MLTVFVPEPGAPPVSDLVRAAAEAELKEVEWENEPDYLALIVGPQNYFRISTMLGFGEGLLPGCFLKESGLFVVAFDDVVEERVRPGATRILNAIDELFPDEMRELKWLFPKQRALMVCASAEETALLCVYEPAEQMGDPMTEEDIEAMIRVAAYHPNLTGFLIVETSVDGLEVRDEAGNQLGVNPVPMSDSHCFYPIQQPGQVLLTFEGLSQELSF